MCFEFYLLNKRNLRGGIMIKAEEHLKLAYKVANEVHKKGDERPLDELISIAMLGLVRASNNFDEKKGFKFSTYAINTMRGYIRTEYFHDKNRFIRKRNDNKEVYEKVNISSLNNTLPLEGKKIEVIENCVSNFEIDNEIEKLDLKIAINKLKNKEKQIIQLLFFEGKTQNEVAKLLGTNQVQISRIKRRAISSLRESLIA